MSTATESEEVGRWTVLTGAKANADEMQVEMSRERASMILFCCVGSLSNNCECKSKGICGGGGGTAEVASDEGGGMDSVVTTNFMRWRQSILFGYITT